MQPSNECRPTGTTRLLVLYSTERRPSAARGDDGRSHGTCVAEIRRDAPDAQDLARRLRPEVIVLQVQGPGHLAEELESFMAIPSVRSVVVRDGTQVLARFSRGTEGDEASSGSESA